ncbi:hypothetical protein QQF64_025553 [Cirrhinus molitorella]|uniref:Uncharacterized protein n=1 Tax=Cirrhinus molitorella TaxID=172907 RepID=A0ABR3NPC6_9TELE
MLHIADEFAAKMKVSVLFLYFFVTLCPLSEGLPLTCPSPFLNEAAHLGSGKLCATLQLQSKFPCPSVSLAVSENVQVNPEKWHLESLSLKLKQYEEEAAAREEAAAEEAAAREEAAAEEAAAREEAAAEEAAAREEAAAEEAAAEEAAAEEEAAAGVEATAGEEAALGEVAALGEEAAIGESGIIAFLEEAIPFLLL